jgi:hypothetical protein
MRRFDEASRPLAAGIAKPTKIRTAWRQCHLARIRTMARHDQPFTAFAKYRHLLAVESISE